LHFVDDVPIILGWGVNKKLDAIANLAAIYLQDKRKFGKLKAGTEYFYHHPLQRIKKDEISWVDLISSQINEASL